MDKKVILYSQPTCPPCHEAKTWMIQNDIPFEVRDLTENPAYIDELIKLGVGATPALIIGEELVLGFSPERIQEAWDTYVK